MNTIEIQHVTKRFGARVAVDDLSLEIQSGEMFALLGMNGAGKTTLISMLNGLLKPDSGEIRVVGAPAGSEEAMMHMGFSPQSPALAENLTVRENLTMIAQLYGVHDVRAAVNEQLKMFSLEEIVDQRAKKLSGGWKRRLCIAMAMIAHPDVLVLDEPLYGLDVLARRELQEVIRELRGRTTILLITHYPCDIEELADRIGIMAHGRLVAVGTAEKLMERKGVIDFEDAYIAFSGEELLD